MRRSSIGSWTSRFPRVGRRPGSRWAGVAAAVMGLTLLVGGAALAAPPILITQAELDGGNYVISQPGSYQFAGDLSHTNSSSAAITITAGSVDLNGAGYTLRGPGGTSVGITVQSAGVQIHNVNVTQFGKGIQVGGGVTVNGNTIRNAGGGIGIVVSGQNNAVTGNTVSNAATGVVVFSANNTLIGNTVVGNFGDGIEVNASNNVVTGNTADHNGNFGIRLQAGATGNLVRGNTASSNGNVGIRAAAGSAGNRIQGNTALSNGSNDLLDNNGTCDSNTWVGNLFGFGRASPDCIQ